MWKDWRQVQGLTLNLIVALVWIFRLRPNSCCSMFVNSQWSCACPGSKLNHSQKNKHPRRSPKILMFSSCFLVGLCSKKCLPYIWFIFIINYKKYNSPYKENTCPKSYKIIYYLLWGQLYATVVVLSKVALTFE